jgi:hypothetical protein
MLAATVMFFRVVSREGFSFIDSAIPMHSSLIRSFPYPAICGRKGVAKSCCKHTFWSVSDNRRCASETTAGTGFERANIKHMHVVDTKPLQTIFHRVITDQPDVAPSIPMGAYGGANHDEGNAAVCFKGTSGMPFSASQRSPRRRWPCHPGCCRRFRHRRNEPIIRSRSCSEMGRWRTSGKRRGPSTLFALMGAIFCRIRTRFLGTRARLFALIGYSSVQFAAIGSEQPIKIDDLSSKALIQPMDFLIQQFEAVDPNTHTYACLSVSQFCPRSSDLGDCCSCCRQLNRLHRSQLTVRNYYCATNVRRLFVSRNPACRIFPFMPKNVRLISSTKRSSQRPNRQRDGRTGRHAGRQTE